MTVAILALLIGLVALYYWVDKALKQHFTYLKALEDNQFAIKEYVENLNDSVAKLSKGHNIMVATFRDYMLDMKHNDPYFELINSIAEALDEQGKRIELLEEGKTWNL